MASYLLRLRLAHKLLISSLAFSLPMAVLLYFIVTGFTAEIEFAQTELKGMRALAPLQDLMERLPRRRPGEDAEIDAAFRRLTASPGGLDQQRIQAARSAWDASRARPDEAEAHRALMRQLQALLKRLGDSSNLILDSRMDTYYVVNVVLVDLPQVIVLLDAANGANLPEQAIELGAVAERVHENAATALREDSRFEAISATLQAKLPPLVQAHQAALAAYLESARAAHDPRSPALARTRNAAFEAAIALWRGSARELDLLVRNSMEGHQRRRFFVLGASLGALSLAILLVLYISRAATRPLELATAIAGQIASGRLDLAQASLEGPEAKRLLSWSRHFDDRVSDESWRLFRAFETMAASLRALLDQVRQSGVQVGGSVTAMASAVKQLEATVAEQAASTAEVAATNKEISSSVRALAQTMQTVGQMASEAAGLAGSGVDDLGRIGATMENLLQATAGLSQILLKVSEQSTRITDVITVITKVANRTNLLSLNAAIEAEKAGESAAGFSVVAAEIRRLADQTAVSALAIERSIDEMRAAVGEGVKGIAEYSRNMRDGSTSTAAITASLAKLLEQTRMLGPHFDSVNQGMQGQAQGAGQIMEAIEQLSEGAVHTKEAIAELQQVSLQMRSAVQGLQTGVARFSTAG